MWDTILSNIPATMVILIAVIICGAELIKAIKVWREAAKERRQKEQNSIQKEIDMKAEFKALHDKLDSIDGRLDGLDKRMKDAETRLDGLTESDMHDIKAWIVEKYHEFYTVQGWIDAFNAETIDKRYEDYVREGGNSYIDTLMERLHSLPMDPPFTHRD